MADIVIVIGTSLQVYPAAGLLDFTQSSTKIYNIDPNSVVNTHDNRFTIIKQKAGSAVPKLVNELIQIYS